MSGTPNSAVARGEASGATDDRAELIDTGPGGARISAGEVVNPPRPSLQPTEAPTVDVAPTEAAAPAAPATDATDDGGF